MGGKKVDPALVSGGDRVGRPDPLVFGDLAAVDRHAADARGRHHEEPGEEPLRALGRRAPLGVRNQGGRIDDHARLFDRLAGGALASRLQRERIEAVSRIDAAARKNPGLRRERGLGSPAQQQHLQSPGPIGPVTHEDDAGGRLDHSGRLCGLVFGRL